MKKNALSYIPKSCWFFLQPKKEKKNEYEKEKNKNWKII